MQAEGKGQSRNWCFTFNNPEYQIDVVLEEALQEGRINYAVWQLECGESGTEHYQGFVQLPRSQRLSFVRKLESNAHWSIARKPIKAEAYCRKDDTRIDGPYTVGIWDRPNQGYRTDIEELKIALTNGATDQELINNHFGEWIKYQRGITATRQVLGRRRTWRTELHIVLGKPGLGKTTLAMATGDGFFKDQSTGQWWDGYSGESRVVLDEFNGFIPYSQILRMADLPPLKIQVKGGTADFLAKELWITNNHRPEEWWSAEVSAKQDWAAFYRRVTAIYIFTALGQFTKMTAGEYLVYREVIN